MWVGLTTIATIVTDEAGLAKVAGEQGCPQRIIQFLDDIEKGDEKGEISQDVASRAREVRLTDEVFEDRG